MQVSELAKLAVVLWTAMLCAKKGDEVRRFRRGLLPILTVLAPLLALIFLEPDLSTAVEVGCSRWWCSSPPGRGSATSSSSPSVALRSSGAVEDVQYQLARVVTFLDPGADRLEATYQVDQSLIGLGAGRLFGVGFGQGQQKLGFLPYPYSDFIFSTIGEEWGFIGISVILLLFATFVWLGFRIARSASDRFGQLLAVGLTALIGISALLHVGVTLALLPATGVTLPFISFGRSSLFISLVVTGVLVSIARGRGARGGRPCEGRDRRRRHRRPPHARPGAGAGVARHAGRRRDPARRRRTRARIANPPALLRIRSACCRWNRCTAARGGATRACRWSRGACGVRWTGCSTPNSRRSSSAPGDTRRDRRCGARSGAVCRRRSRSRMRFPGSPPAGSRKARARSTWDSPKRVSGSRWGAPPRCSPSAIRSVHPSPAIAPPRCARSSSIRARPCVLVFGGSQGARAVNNALAGALERDLLPTTNVLWGTGAASAAALARHAQPGRVVVRGFFDPMTPAYRAADLVVCRAGAMTVAELCAWGKASVLVPLPTAAADHQTYNARALADVGAAVLLPESELSPESLADARVAGDRGSGPTRVAGRPRPRPGTPRRSPGNSVNNLDTYPVTSFASFVDSIY